MPPCENACSLSINLRLRAVIYHNYGMNTGCTSSNVIRGKDAAGKNANLKCVEIKEGALAVTFTGTGTLTVSFASTGGSIAFFSPACAVIITADSVTAFAVTLPVWSTSTFALSLEDQVTVAPAGSVVATRVSVSSTCNERVF